jgi:hypothetical protein
MNDKLIYFIDYMDRSKIERGGGAPKPSKENGAVESG